MTLVVAPSGVEITELMLELDLRDYACGDTTMSGGLGVGTEGPIAIDGGSFESSSSSVVWEGAFESELRAVGTVEGNIPDPMGGQGCDIGPLSWTAEPDGSATETEATEGTEAPTTTSTPTTGSAPEAEEAQERDEAELTTERLAAVDLADRFWGFTEDQKGAICSNFDADPSGEWMAFASSGGEASEAMFVEFVTDWCAADSIAPPEPPSDRAIEDFFVDLYADVLEDDLLRSEGCRLFVLDPSEAWAAQTEVDSFTDEDRPYTEAQFYSFQLKMCAFQL